MISWECMRGPGSLNVTITSVISRGACVIPALPAPGRTSPEPSLGSGWQLVVEPGFHRRIIPTGIKLPKDFFFNEEMHNWHTMHEGSGWLRQDCDKDSSPRGSSHSDSPFRPEKHIKMQLGE